ncbi:MAG: hypothetical protein ACI4JK_03430 [Oscillospiraceae bacterium]
MEEYGYFPDVNYGPDDFTTYFRDFFSNGIKADNTEYFAVIPESGMDLTVKAGIAYIDGHFYRPFSDIVLTLEESDTEFSRIDLIQIKCDYVESRIYVEVVTGEPSEVPAVPQLQRDASAYCLGVAAVTVAPNVSEIGSKDIKDLRFDTDYCGVVVGKVGTISTDYLFSQYEAQWNLLKAACAQDAEAVIAAWDALNTVKSVNKLIPINGDLTLTQSLIPSDGVAFQFPFYIQSGTVTVSSTAASSGVSVTLPVKYKAAPLVILSGSTFSSGGQQPIVASYTDVTAQGFKIYAYQIATIPSQLPSSGTVNWVTLGVLPIVIIKQPVDVTVAVGKKATFTVAANGEGLTYQWQISTNGGSTWKSFANTTDTFSITAKADYDGYMYRCIVTDVYGNSVISEGATLYVIGG